MLYLSLAVSAILLVIVNFAARASRQGPIFCAAAALPVAMGLGCLGLGLPAVFLQSMALCVAAGVWWWRAGGRGAFAATSLLVSVAAYAFVWWLMVRPTTTRYEQLRAEFPVITMEPRVKRPQPVPILLSLPAAARLDQFEQRQDTGINFRGRMLQRLHERSTEDFVNATGFGVTRMSFFEPTRDRLVEDPEESVPAQPGERETSASLESDPRPGHAVTQSGDAHRLHESSIDNFLEPNRFGFVKSRREVAGFQPHRFDKTPQSFAQWRLQTLDLIGLLMHDQPVVYVSKHLPRMDKLKDAPTRPLDEFESHGLAAIRSGEDMYAKESDATLRLVGAIRATKQCTTCHGCERGDLLGAFSYTLKLAP